MSNAAEGIVLASERYDGGEPVNLGSGMEISIRDLVETIARLTGYQGDIVWDASKPNGQPRRQLDVSRAEQLFGFRARAPRSRRACAARSSGIGRSGPKWWGSGGGFATPVRFFGWSQPPPWRASQKMRLEGRSPSDTLWVTSRRAGAHKPQVNQPCMF